MKQRNEQKHSDDKECKDIWIVPDEDFMNYLRRYFEYNTPRKMSWIERLYKWLFK